MNKNKRDFAIISTQRSGTQFLSSLLASHPDFQAAKEILDPKKRNNFLKFVEESTGRPDRPYDDEERDEFRQLFSSYLQTLRSARNQIVLVMMYNHFERVVNFNPGEFLGSLNLVHLIRRNMLRTYVSDAINNMRVKPPHHQGDPGADKLVRIHIPPEAILENLQRRATQIENYRQILSQHECVEVIYEDVAADPSNLNRLLERFGYENDSLATKLKRSNPQPLSDIIENFSEVEDILSGTEFSGLVHD